MEFWQFICYLEGYRENRINKQIDDILNAARIGAYVGQYWTGKKAPDAKNLVSKLEAMLDRDYVEKIVEEKTDEEKIEELKEKLKLFD